MGIASIKKINKISIINVLTGEKVLELEEPYTYNLNITIDVTNDYFDNLETQKSTHRIEIITLESQDKT